MTRARDERSGDDDGHEKRQDTGTPGARPDDGSEHRHANASDARLTALLRADSPIAYTALRELRERHHPSVLAYARLCAASESSALELATQAFTTATRETARGTEAAVPWRHQLLLLTVRVAATWTTDEHATGLAPALRPVLAAAGPEGPVPPLLAAFQLLPPRPQGLIWYGAVEQEPDERTAVLLGLTPDDVAYRRESALQPLRQACLRVRLAASDDPRCQDFRRLIEESVRPDSPRHSTDLHAHMAYCPYCAGAYEELCALRDSPRATLAEGLLPWGGTAYTRGSRGARGAGAEDFTDPEAQGRDEAARTPGAGARGGGWAEAAAATAAAAEAWTESGLGGGAPGRSAAPGAGPARASDSGTGTASGSGSGRGSGSGTRSGPGPAAASGSGSGQGSGAYSASASGFPSGDSDFGSAFGSDFGSDFTSGFGSGDGDRSVGGMGAEPRAGAATAAGAWAAGPPTEPLAPLGAEAPDGVPRAKWSRSRRIALTSVALGVALAPLLAFLVFSGPVGSSSDDAAGSGGTPAVPPSESVTPTAPPTPTPSPTPSETASPSKPPRKEKPTRSPSPRPSDTGSPTPSPPSGGPLSGAYTQVVNVASGLCLDIRGPLAKGTDVVTATCSSRATQRWRLDSGRGVLQSFADPDLCLDSRGAVDDGVGVWECDSLDGENGDNLRFEVDSRGAIRPAVAGRFAVTPDALGSVGFAVASGREGQRWKAGAGPVSS